MMDKKTALKTLHLNNSSSLEDAKKAYWNLAKKYHPDKTCENSSQKHRGESKMKEINLAFRFLTPLLKPNRITPKKDEKAPLVSSGKSVSLTSLMGKIKGVFTIVFKTESRRFSKNRPVNPRQKIKIKKTRIRFDDVLGNTNKDRGDFHGAVKKKGNSPKIRRVGRYKDNKTLIKRGGPSLSGRNRCIGIEGIEKIQPVSAVRPVKKI